METRSREIWLDWMRVAACLMVMLVHATEPFYLGGEGSLILTRGDAFWAALSDCFARACVPLFVVASSYLQFPLHYSPGEFFRRRVVRILIPFTLWSLLYALVWGKPVENLRDLLWNFNYAAGHLWFIYMLAGVYLLMPLLSPWAEKVSRKELRIYLAIWLFTTLIPLLRDWLSGAAPTVIYGPSGLPRQALYPLWGEASWNGYGVFYYLSGFVGYLLLGLYFRRFVGPMSWGRTLAVAIPCFLGGLAVTMGGFLRRVMADAGGVFPVEGPVDKAVWWETTWCNDTVGVVLMTVAWVVVFRKISCAGSFYKSMVLPLSKAGFGMYLSHLLLLVPLSGAFRTWLGIGADGRLGLWTTPVEILLTTASSFLLAGVLCVLIQRIPRIGKYLMG